MELVKGVSLTWLSVLMVFLGVAFYRIRFYWVHNDLERVKKIGVVALGGAAVILILSYLLDWYIPFMRESGRPVGAIIFGSAIFLGSAIGVLLFFGEHAAKAIVSRFF